MQTTLYHTTHKKNVRSILTHGLLLSRATNKKLPFVWFDVDASHAIRCHVAAKHGWVESDMVTFEVTLPAKALVRHPLNVCVWGEARKHKGDVSPSRIKVLASTEQGWL